MSTRRLERVGLDPHVIACFSRNGISTVGDLFLTSPLAMMVYADLSLKDVKNIIAKVSEKVHCKPSSALDVLHKRAQKKQFLPTGLATLDKALKGGLLIGCISEISGPPGVGKTQFCLSCTLQTIAQSHLSLMSSGFSGADSNRSTALSTVVYFDTELKFDPNRLIQIAIETFPELYSSEFRTDAPHQVDKLLSCVKIIRPASCRELSEEVTKLQSVVISQNVSMIVIDSVAALARKEALNERDKELYFISMAAGLKKIAEMCNCVVLATNQVTMASSANPAALYNDAILDEHGQAFQPALGPTWHHCVSIRLTMNTAMTTPSRATSERDRRAGDEQQQQQAKQKFVSITKSPISGPHSLPFVIASSGLVSPPQQK